MELPAVAVAQTAEEKFRDYLASQPRPKRFTEQQRDLVRFIFDHHSHFDADQLCDDLRKAGLDVSRATVYRTLEKLVDAGLLRQLETGPRKKYEHDYGYPQHEHMVCQLCGAMIEFQNPAVDAIIQSIAREQRFTVSGHSFIIRGTCADCTRTRVTKRRLDLI